MLRKYENKIIDVNQRFIEEHIKNNYRFQYLYCINRKGIIMVMFYTKQCLFPIIDRKPGNVLCVMNIPKKPLGQDKITTHINKTAQCR